MPKILSFTGVLSVPQNRRFVSFDSGAAAVAGVHYTSQPSGITEGSSQTLSFRLTTQPTSIVVVTVSSGDTSALTTTGGSFVSFTTSNWDTAQSITLTSPADTDIADETVTVTLTGTTADSDYTGVISTFGVTVTDVGAVDDFWFWDTNGDSEGGNDHEDAPADGAGSITQITAGTAVPVWVTLSQNPGANVTISLSEDADGLSISKTSLGSHKLNGNWNARGGGHGFTITVAGDVASDTTFSITATGSSTDFNWDDRTATLTVIAE